MKPITLLFSLLFSLYLGYILGTQDYALQHVLAFSTSAPPTTKEKTLSTSQPLTDKQSECNCHQSATSPQANEKKPLSISALFSQLLNSEKYSEAMEIYHATWNISEENSSTLRTLFIQHLQSLFNRLPEHNLRLNEAINTYLADFYDDIDILLLKAKGYTQQHLFYDSISTFQLANSYAYNEQQKQKISNEYNHFINYITTVFGEKQQWEKLTELFIFAKNADLLTLKNQFNLIEFYLFSGNEYQAKISAQKLSKNIEWEEKVVQLLNHYQLNFDENNNQDTDNKPKSSIPLEQIANQFIITVNLSRIPTRLLIDTGASVTTISKNFYQKIKSSTNLSYIKKQTFLTANGKTNGEIYRLDEFIIGEYTIKDIEIAVLDFPTSKHSSGLLGMNVLRHFRFEIDQKNSLLNLESTGE